MENGSLWSLSRKPPRDRRVHGWVDLHTERCRFTFVDTP